METNRGNELGVKNSRRRGGMQDETEKKEGIKGKKEAD